MRTKHVQDQSLVEFVYLEVLDVVTTSKRLATLVVRLLIIYTTACSLPCQHLHLKMLVFCWSTETRTFVTAWGEFTSAIEDAMQITHLPPFG